MLDRILTIPERPEREPVARGGLRPLQIAALQEAQAARGLFGAISVGYGKTLITLLLARAMGAKRPLLLIPALTKRTVYRECHKFRKRFRMHPRLKIKTYEWLAHKRRTRWLFRYKPDLIIADEAHWLRHLDASRSYRVFVYVMASECMFACLSGTMITDQIVEYAHLLRMALKDNAPVPFELKQIRQLQHVLNTGERARKKALEACRPLVRVYGEVGELAAYGGEETSQILRQCLRRRLEVTPGVVMSKEGSVQATLFIHEHTRPKVPDKVQRAIAHVQKKHQNLKGHDLAGALQVYENMLELLSGFFYTLAWPGGKPNQRWLNARRTWKRCVREVLKNKQPGLDSPALVEHAVAKGQLEDYRKAWVAWRRVAKLAPKRRVAWLSTYLTRWAYAWLKKQRRPSIVWYKHQAVGHMLAQYPGLKVFGEGDPIPSKVAHCALSMDAFGTGVDGLQRWSNQLILCPVGIDMEQLLGRTHRHGQRAHAVHAHVLVHHPLFKDAWEQAKERAVRLEDSSVQRQKLVYANYV